MTEFKYNTKSINNNKFTTRVRSKFYMKKQLLQ